MAKTKACLVVIMFLLGGSVYPVRADKEDGLNISGLFKVTADHSVLGHNGDRTIGALAASTAMIEKAKQGLVEESMGTSVYLRNWETATQVDSGNWLMGLEYDGWPVKAGDKSSIFLQRIADAMQVSLQQSFEDTRMRLGSQLDHAHKRQAELETELALPQTKGRSSRVQQQLDTLVDLSMLRPEMAASEAFEIICAAVDPPLNMAVMWKDLLDIAEVEPSTPIDIDGLPEVRLGTGLDVICKALAGGFYDVGFVIHENVVVVATRETLDGMKWSQPKTPSSSSYRLSPSDIRERCRELSQERDRLDTNISELEARHKAVTEEIQRLRHDIEDRVLASEGSLDLVPLVKALETQQQNTQKMIDAGRARSADLVDVLDKLAQAKTRMAEYRIELTERYGGKLLQDLSNQLTELTIELAGGQAMLQGITEQLQSLEAQLKTAAQAEAEYYKEELKRKALQDTLKEVHRLEEQLDQLTPPSVVLMQGS